MVPALCRAGLLVCGRGRVCRGRGRFRVRGRDARWWRRCGPGAHRGSAAAARGRERAGSRCGVRGGLVREAGQGGTARGGRGRGGSGRRAGGHGPDPHGRGAAARRSGARGLRSAGGRAVGTSPVAAGVGIRESVDTPGGNHVNGRAAPDRRRPGRGGWRPGRARPAGPASRRAALASHPASRRGGRTAVAPMGGADPRTPGRRPRARWASRPWSEPRGRPARVHRVQPACPGARVMRSTGLDLAGALRPSRGRRPGRGRRSRPATSGPPLSWSRDTGGSECGTRRLQGPWLYTRSRDSCLARAAPARHGKPRPGTLQGGDMADAATPMGQRTVSGR